MNKSAFENKDNTLKLSVEGLLAIIKTIKG